MEKIQIMFSTKGNSDGTYALLKNGVPVMQIKLLDVYSLQMLNEIVAEINSPLPVKPVAKHVIFNGGAK